MLLHAAYRKSAGGGSICAVISRLARSAVQVEAPLVVRCLCVPSPPLSRARGANAAICFRRAMTLARPRETPGL
eukprot:8776877-Lingulodinium_polyedra.AAC.1